MQIRGDNCVKAARIIDHAHCHRVYKHFIPLDSALPLLRYLIEDGVPQHHAVTLCVALRNHREKLSRARIRGGKCETEYSLKGGSSEDGDFGSGGER